MFVLFFGMFRYEGCFLLRVPTRTKQPHGLVNVKPHFQHLNGLLCLDDFSQGQRCRLLRSIDLQGFFLRGGTNPKDGPTPKILHPTPHPHLNPYPTHPAHPTPPPPHFTPTPQVAFHRKATCTTSRAKTWASSSGWTGTARCTWPGCGPGPPPRAWASLTPGACWRLGAKNPAAFLSLGLLGPPAWRRSFFLPFLLFWGEGSGPY